MAVARRVSTRPGHRPRPLADRRQVVLGGLLAAFGVGSVALRPHSRVPVLSKQAMDAAIPATVGRYAVASVEGLVLPPTDELTSRLYDQVLTRIYQAPGSPPLALLIAYGRAQDTDIRLHRPDECYPAQGFAISDQRHAEVALAGRRVTGTILSAHRSDRDEQVLFWTRIADTSPPEAAGERSVIIRAKLAGRMPDGVLVRLSAIMAEQGPALRLMQGFVAELSANLNATGQRLLLGQPEALRGKM